MQKCKRKRYFFFLKSRHRNLLSHRFISHSSKQSPLAPNPIRVHVFVVYSEPIEIMAVTSIFHLYPIRFRRFPRTNKTRKYTRFPPFVEEIFRKGYCIRGNCTSDKYFLYKLSAVCKSCKACIINGRAGRVNIVSPFYFKLLGFLPYQIKPKFYQRLVANQSDFIKI